MRRPLALLLCAVCIAAADDAKADPSGADADTDLVLLANGHRLEGVLDDAPDDASRVLIRTKYGSMEVERQSIKGIQPGLATRLKHLHDDDPAGLAAFARWALAHGHEAEATDALYRADAWWTAHPDGPIDLPALGLYAWLVDKGKGATESLDIYRRYRARGGTEQIRLDRLAALEEYAAKLGLPAAAPGATGKAFSPAQPGAALVPSGGGIELRGWAAEALQWSNPVTPHPVVLKEDDLAPGITQALQVDVDDGDKDKAVIRRPMTRSLENQPMVVMRVRNKLDAPLLVSLAFKTGDWVFQESLGMKVAANSEWTELRFNLKDAKFKSQATNWSYSGTIDHLDDVKEIQILLYNGHHAGAILINGMRFIGKQEL